MSSDLSIMRDIQEPLISIHNLGKRYDVYRKPHHRLLREITRGKSAYHREFWALRGLDLQVYPGETVGIIGRNGAGKSTLLQLICGIVQPTTGEIKVNGRIAGLLELGAGFNPEFTGRDNVYLKGSLLGMTRAQINARFEEILAFSEIGDYIEQPVKTYSSGMFVRLAFAVSICADPDILIVDEALAVGDMYFQRKCHQRIREMQERGCTLLLVTHSADAMARLCKRGVVLDKGVKIFDGAVRSAVSEYMRLVFGGAHEKASPGQVKARTAASGGGDDALARLRAGGGQDLLATRPGYNRGEIRVGNGKAIVADFALAGANAGTPVANSGDSVRFLVRYHFREAVERLIFGFQVRSSSNVVVYSTNTFYETGDLLANEAGDVVIGTVSFKCNLLPGQYYITLGVSQFDERRDNIEALDRRMDVLLLTVLGDRLRAQGVAALDAKLSTEVMS
jgi:lipopolysaccharide transport system ATP-binding protein